MNHPVHFIHIYSKCNSSLVD